MTAKSDEYYCMLMQNERFEAFKAQDLQNGCFDVTFEIEKKLVYAHKSTLGLVSETFRAMFSDSWNKNNVIEVQTYPYDQFVNLLNFIYSGKCELDGKNIAKMVDMSEFYNINALRQKCHDFLLEMELTSEELLELYDFLKQYHSFKTVLESKLVKNYSEILDAGNFINLQKDTLEGIVSLERVYAIEEKLFKMVYQWAENQAATKYPPLATTPDLNECIKNALQGILPYIRFNAMDEEFVKTFVAKKCFLFTGDELSEILCNIKRFKVEITDISGKKLYGDLIDQDFVVDEIKKIENCHGVLCQGPDLVLCYWNVQRPIKFKYRLLKQNPCSNYFLQIGCETGRLILRNQMETNYLLAEFVGDYDFSFQKCKIRIF